MSDKISGKFHPIPRNLKKIVFFVVSMAMAGILKILLKRWISIRNIIIYLETKFRPNRRILYFGDHCWFKIIRATIANQNGRHMVLHILLPVNIHFHWNLFIFEFLTIVFNFYIGGHLENFKNERAQLWVMIYFCVRFQKDPLYCLNLTFFTPWLPWQRPPFWICSTPNRWHTLRWIFLQSFMKFDERNPEQFLIPLFCIYGSCGKVCPTDSDFLGLSRSIRCGCCS